MLREKSRDQKLSGRQVLEGSESASSLAALLQLSNSHCGRCDAERDLYCAAVIASGDGSQTL